MRCYCSRCCCDTSCRYTLPRVLGFCLEMDAYFMFIYWALKAALAVGSIWKTGITSVQ